MVQDNFFKKGKSLDLLQKPISTCREFKSFVVHLLNRNTRKKVLMQDYSIRNSLGLKQIFNSKFPYRNWQTI